MSKTTNNAWLVCYVMRYNLNGRFTDRDYYIVFIEEDEAGNSPRVQAENLFKSLQDGDLDYENQEMYSANICKVIDSTESTYLNINENK